METKSIEGWAVVELMGHQTIAGYVRTEAFGSVAMLRVDVPELPAREFDRYGRREQYVQEPAYTKYHGMQAIYGLALTTEQHVREVAERIRKVPPRVLEIPDALPAVSERYEDEEHLLRYPEDEE